MMLMVFSSCLACSAMTHDAPEGSRAGCPSSVSDDPGQASASAGPARNPCCNPSIGWHLRSLLAFATQLIAVGPPGDRIVPQHDGRSETASEWRSQETVK